MNTQLHIMIDEDLRESAKQLAKSMGLSLSDICRLAVIEYLKTNAPE